MHNDTDIHFLRMSNEVGKRAVALGNHPFGAVLVAPDNETVLLTQCNIDTVNHAESTLARIAASNFTAEYLWGCTLYTAVEPCCMCAATLYWANIGRVVYGISEARLLACTGNHPENPTMSLPAATVFRHGQKAIVLTGPVHEIEEETLALQQGFWQTRR
ncbi:nucleoside deaminase [Pantoea sp. KPR_PJ]|uniref:nucleoside deaminase n=1 Tax=Pantoea sp. KPR_PJ TaxID=2738375 RepID=UPI0035283437